MAQIIPLFESEIPSHGIYYVDEPLAAEDPGSIEEPILDSPLVRMLGALAITCLGLAVGFAISALVLR